MQPGKPAAAIAFLPWAGSRQKRKTIFQNADLLHVPNTKLKQPKKVSQQNIKKQNKENKKIRE
jgi:hypothetical protein